MAFAQSVGPAALALALVPGLLPGLALAQAGPGASVPSGDHAALRSPDGVELGIASTIVLIFPAVGGQISVPTHTGLRVEASAQALPWLLEDGDNIGLMTQVQLRIPFRRGPPGSRRSVVAGLTAFTLGDRWDWADAFVRPHAGVSWQWQTHPRMDVRFDLHALITGESAPVVVPFGMFALVWHGERRLR